MVLGLGWRRVFTSISGSRFNVEVLLPAVPGMHPAIQLGVTNGPGSVPLENTDEGIKPLLALTPDGVGSPTSAGSGGIVLRGVPTGCLHVACRQLNWETALPLTSELRDSYLCIG